MDNTKERILNYYGIGSEYKNSPSYEEFNLTQEFFSEMLSVHQIRNEMDKKQRSLDFKGLKYVSRPKPSRKIEKSVIALEDTLGLIFKKWLINLRVNKPNGYKTSEKISEFFNFPIDIDLESPYLDRPLPFRLEGIDLFISSVFYLPKSKKSVLTKLFSLLMKASRLAKRYRLKSKRKDFQGPEKYDQRLERLFVKFMKIYQCAYVEPSSYIKELKSHDLTTFMSKAELKHQESVLLMYFKTLMTIVCNYVKIENGDIRLLELNLPILKAEIEESRPTEKTKTTKKTEPMPIQEPQPDIVIEIFIEVETLGEIEDDKSSGSTEKSEEFSNLTQNYLEFSDLMTDFLKSNLCMKLLLPKRKLSSAIE